MLTSLPPIDPLIRAFASCVTGWTGPALRVKLSARLTSVRSSAMYLVVRLALL